MPTTDSLNIEISASTGSAVSNIQRTADALQQLENNAKSADTDVSQLVRGMTDAAANMQSISSNIAISSAGLASFQTNIDAVSAALLGVNSRFDMLNGSLQQSYTAFDSAASSVNLLSGASENSAKALDSIVTSTDGFAGKMGDLKTATTGTSDGMTELQRELRSTLTTIQGFSGNLGNAGRDAEGASRKIREISEQVRGIPTKQPTALAYGFNKLKGIIATLGIGAFVKQSDDMYKVQMSNELKLMSHMKRRMKATDEEVQSIKELASAQQKIGIIGDEIQLAGAQQLTTYARQASTLKTLIPAMNDLIAQNAGYEASVSDAISAADMLGKAMDGQYTALKRMGVSFTAAQEQVLKYGTEQQKASVLADAINEKVGNMNQLLAQTPTGQMKQLQNEFGDLREQFGATFQPLISSLVPVARNVLYTLAPPILNVSKGIAVMGGVLAQIDSPAVRAIALTAAGVAIVNKLRFAVGSTAAGILVAGVLLTGLIGSMQKEQQSIGDIVSDAYGAAADATGTATDAAEDYKNELGEVQKTASRLAGFDTITKLSGNTKGSLAGLIIGDGDTSEVSDYADELKDIMESSMSDIMLPEIDFRKVGAKIHEFTSQSYNELRKFGQDLSLLISGWGNDDAMYQPLSKMTGQIEDLLNGVGLDGTGFVNFWKGVGADVYKVMAGGDSDIMKGMRELDSAFRYMLGDFGKGWSDFWQRAGGGLYELTHQGQINDQAIADKYSLADINDLIVDGLKKGLSSEDAISSAKMQYLTSSEAVYWYENLIKPEQRSYYTVENWRNNLIESGQIPYRSQGTSYVDVPLRPSGMPSNVPVDQIAPQVNVYINEEKYDPTAVKVNNGKKVGYE